MSEYRESLAELVLMDIVKAWVIPGPCPPYHRKMQRKLKKEWPTLYKAIMQAVRRQGRYCQNCGKELTSKQAVACSGSCILELTRQLTEVIHAN